MNGEGKCVVAGATLRVTQQQMQAQTSVLPRKDEVMVKNAPISPTSVEMCVKNHLLAFLVVVIC